VHGELLMWQLLQEADPMLAGAGVRSCWNEVGVQEVQLLQEADWFGSSVRSCWNEVSCRTGLGAAGAGRTGWFGPDLGKTWITWNPS
jgi:hypothetical protein